MVSAASGARFPTCRWRRLRAPRRWGFTPASSVCVPLGGGVGSVCVPPRRWGFTPAFSCCVVVRASRPTLPSCAIRCGVGFTFFVSCSCLGLCLLVGSFTACCLPAPIDTAFCLWGQRRGRVACGDSGVDVWRDGEGVGAGKSLGRGGEGLWRQQRWGRGIVELLVVALRLVESASSSKAPVPI